ncbi:unnamed protein product, partial [Thelazia callipaeda]|uniref:C2H2-type domain-containing protein n=1 Tax=Thelazia callipaeda TaxID=103827 RepID=A0A0N5CS27_THECL
MFAKSDFKIEQLDIHMRSHQLTVDVKELLIHLNNAESAQSIAVSNNMSLNNTHEENMSTFPFRMVKQDLDDEVQFSSSSYVGTDDQSLKSGRISELSVSKTVQSNSMTSIRSKSDTTKRSLSSSSVHREEITQTCIISSESDEVAVANILEKVINAVIFPPSHNVVSNDCISSTIQKSGTCSVTSSVINEQTEESVGNCKTSASNAKSKERIDGDLKFIRRNLKQNGSRNMSRREAKFCCNQCTEKFLTKSSLMVHKNSHKYDAGQTIEPVYGIPTEVTLYICRLCCLAYESQAVYQLHMGTHGILRNCGQCSLITFSDEQLKSHQQRHGTRFDKQRIVYICSRCAITYSTVNRFLKKFRNINHKIWFLSFDARLYHHMFTIHGVILLYFCKNCGLANSNGRIVYEHIVTNACSYKVCLFISKKLMGFTAACIFHYQPINRTEHEKRLKENTLPVVVPSQCIHRSFLCQTGDLFSITCPTCHSLMIFTRLEAENPAFIKTLPRILYQGDDNNDLVMLTLLNNWSKSHHGSTSRFILPASSLPKQETRQLLNNCAMRQLIVHSPCVSTVRPLCSTSNSSLSSLPSSLYAVKSVTNAVAVGPSSPTTSMQNLVRSSISAAEIRFQGVHAYRGVLEAVDLSIFNPRTVNNDYILKTAEGRFFCTRTECANIRIEKITSGRVHNLRHNLQNIFFCLECGAAFPCEVFIVKHMINLHHQKRTPELNLHCPLCPRIPFFTSVDLFKKHMASAAHTATTHFFTFRQ